MITILRRIFSSPLGKILALFALGVIAFSFAASDVSSGGAFGGIARTDVATVGDKQIGIGDFQQRVRRNYERTRTDQPALTMSAYIAAGGLEATLTGMIEESAYEQYARRIGFSTTKRLVDGRIADMQAFTGLTGQFDKNRFEATLQQQGLTERALRDDIERTLLFEQFAAPMQDLSKVSPGFGQLYTILALETRIGKNSVVAAQRFAPKKQPDDTTLAQYLEDNTELFSRPERRAIRYVIFDRNVVQPAPPTEADIAAAYEANQAAYQASETRQFEQVIAPSQEIAEQIHTAATAGQGLNRAANNVGLAANKTSALSQAEFAALTKEEVAAAAFAAPAATLLEPMQVPLGWLIVKIIAVESIPARSLAKATPEIRRALAADKANEALVDFYNGIQDAVNAGASVDEIANDNGLALVDTPPLLATGISPDRPTYKLPQKAQTLIAQSFIAAGEGETHLIDLVSNELFALYEVQTIYPPSPPPLAKIRTLLTAAWQRTQGHQRARKEAEAILAATKEGKNLIQAISGKRAEWPQPINLQRSEILRQGQKASVELTAFFGMSVGEVKMVEIPNDIGWMLLSLDEIRTPDSQDIPPELIEQMRELMTNNIKNEMLSMLIADAKQQIGFEINQSTVEQVRRDMTNLNTDF